MGAPQSASTRRPNSSRTSRSRLLHSFSKRSPPPPQGIALRALRSHVDICQSPLISSPRHEPEVHHRRSNCCQLKQHQFVLVSQAAHCHADEKRFQHDLRSHTPKLVYRVETGLPEVGGAALIEEICNFAKRRLANVAVSLMRTRRASS